jgi:C4-dicarboxylate-specific signal transduction histidine kinase
VTTEGDDYFVHITVSDNGMGIKEEHLDLVFETFFTTKTDSVKGVGWAVGLLRIYQGPRRRYQGGQPNCNNYN